MKTLTHILFARCDDEFNEAVEVWYSEDGYYVVDTMYFWWLLNNIINIILDNIISIEKELKTKNSEELLTKWQGLYVKKDVMGGWMDQIDAVRKTKGRTRIEQDNFSAFCYKFRKETIIIHNSKKEATNE